MTALCQDFLAVLQLYILLAIRQSNGWACSANDKKIANNNRHIFYMSNSKLGLVV